MKFFVKRIGIREIVRFESEIYGCRFAVEYCAYEHIICSLLSVVAEVKWTTR